MRRLVVIAAIALFIAAVLVPTQNRFVASADSAGERLAMFSKPSVVRIVDGASGQILFQPPGEVRSHDALLPPLLSDGQFAVGMERLPRDENVF